MFRALGGFLYALIFLVIGSPMLVIENIKRKKNKAKADMSSLRIVQNAFKAIWHVCGVRLDVIGAEKIPTDQAVLYVCNHKSFFDIIIGYSLCPTLTGYVAKKQIEKVPFLRNWMRRLYCLFMDRDNPKESLKTIKQAVEYVKQGVSICIFPEGTRNPDPNDQLLPFRGGALKIAERTNCPVVPMAITNSSAVIKDHMPFVKPTHVIIEYGDPIMTAELDRTQKKQLSDMARDSIQAMLDKNKALI